MSHKRTYVSPIRLGRGRPLSRVALATLWQAVVSRNPAADWTKGRVVVMVVTVWVLVWGLGGIFELVVQSLGDDTDSQILAIEGLDDTSGDNAGIAGRAQAREHLRSDLFSVPKTRKEETKKEPKTNPVELLRLIELQGVLGGTTPRAIILYKRTKKTATVSVGDDLGEFEVMEIRDRSVILKWREELFELSL